MSGGQRQKVACNRKWVNTISERRTRIKLLRKMYRRLIEILLEPFWPVSGSTCAYNVHRKVHFDAVKTHFSLSALSSHYNCN